MKQALQNPWVLLTVILVIAVVAAVVVDKVIIKRTIETVDGKEEVKSHLFKVKAA